MSYPKNNLITIYVKLLNEAVDCWRPVKAHQLNGERFKILGPVPEAEEWEFSPGKIVSYKKGLLSDALEALVAVGSTPPVV